MKKSKASESSAAASSDGGEESEDEAAEGAEAGDESLEPAEGQDTYDPEVLDASADLAEGESDDDLLGAREEDSEGTAAEGEDDEQPNSAAITRSSEGGLGRFDPLSAYMREVQRHPLLSADEQHQLAVTYQKNPEDLAAAARLVTANLRLVVKIAYEYRRAYKNMMDLIQEGNIGLMQAVKKYDPYRGVKLSSYAAWWIRAYMLRFILNNWRLVKLGTTQAQRKLFFNLSKEKAKLTAMGIEPTDAEIAKRLNVAEAEVAEMDKRLARSDASLDASVGESDGRSVARVELMPAPGSTPEGLAEGAELSEMLQERLSEFREKLTGKDVIIFDKRVVADEPLTLQELGDEFGVSRERVRQLEARLTGKLRDYLKQTLGDAVELS
ncbi:MAG: sigma-70 family RNA polymerase sigma factor [Myxococcales bacterium]|nr:MAG: sigma-70 family RNA polymerase sigma factor [Myxococcales bacterium]